MSRTERGWWTEAASKREIRRRCPSRNCNVCETGAYRAMRRIRLRSADRAAIREGLADEAAIWEDIFVALDGY